MFLNPRRRVGFIYVIAFIVGMLSCWNENNIAQLLDGVSGQTRIEYALAYAISSFGLGLGYYLSERIQYNMGRTMVRWFTYTELGLVLMNGCFFVICFLFYSSSASSGFVWIIRVFLFFVFFLTGMEEILIANLAANLKRKTGIMARAYFISNIGIGAGGIVFVLLVDVLDIIHLSLLTALFNAGMLLVILILFKKVVKYRKLQLSLLFGVCAFIFLIWDNLSLFEMIGVHWARYHI